MKKIDKDPLLKARIVISSIVLSIFIIGWIIYGINITRSNPNLVLRKYLTTQEENISDYLEKNKYDLSSPLIFLLDKDDNPVHFYIDLKNQELYIYNNENYFDVSNYLNTKGMTINYKELTNNNLLTLIKCIKNAIINNYKILDTTTLKDKNNNYYIYHYTLNELSPLLSTLKTDDLFKKTINKILGTNNEDLNSILDRIADKAFGISIGTKGSKRKVVDHSIRINGILTVKAKDNSISGFLGNYGFIYNKDLIISNEKGDYKIIKDNTSFNKDELVEGKLDNILN